MIKFDPALLSVEHVYLKHCTSALGGAMTIVDNEQSTDSTIKFKRISIPSVVVRQFAKVNRVIKYIEPVLCAVTYYGDRVVSLERHGLGNKANEFEENRHGQMVKWRSLSERTIDDVIRIHCNDGNQWYIDGYYVYRFDGNDHIDLSSDNKFKSHATHAYRLSTLAGTAIKGETPTMNATFETRYCISFTPDNGDPTFSPPIWKNVSGIGSGKLGDSSADDDDQGVILMGDLEKSLQTHLFDDIDEHLIVNVAFVIHAATKLSDIFGFKVIEPLAIDRLMISLHTVNVPRIKKAIKNTYDSGLSFTHMFAWILGLSNQSNTLDTLLVIRSVIKHLTSRGIYHSTVSSSIAKYDMDKIPLLTIDEAKEQSAIYSS